MAYMSPNVFGSHISGRDLEVRRYKEECDSHKPNPIEYDEEHIAKMEGQIMLSARTVRVCRKICENSLISTLPSLTLLGAAFSSSCITRLSISRLGQRGFFSLACRDIVNLGNANMLKESSHA